MNSPSTILQDFMKKNDMPSNAIREEVTVILQKPVQDIHGLEVEIQSLEQRLAELKSRRSHSQQQITPYQSILSPIRRLPSDILGEIFYHCLATHRNPVLKATESPMLLTQICSNWRSVAIEDSRLWSRLYITFSDDDLIPVSDVDGINSESWTITLLEASKRRAEHMLRTRIDAVKEWFSRSAFRPLSISLKFTCQLARPTLHSDHNSADDMTLELFQYLASISPRIEDLELNMSIDMYRFLENMVVVSQMKMLKSFRADFHGSSLFSSQISWDTHVGMLSAPNLRKILMTGESASLWKSLEPSHDWSKLTHIACHQSLSVSRLAHFFERSPNLLVFYGRIGLDSDDGALTQAHSFQTEIFLPFLHTLCITDYLSPSTTSKLYSTINAPSLKCLVFSAQYPFQESTQGPPVILPLVHKSGGLKKLSFRTQDFSRWGVNSLFRAVPTITHLVIGTDFRLPPRPDDAPTSYRTIRSPWDLGGLLANHLSSAEMDPPLLPNLEFLDVSIRSIYFSDTKLKDFVISRLDPSSRQRTKPLKHVGVNFFREKEMDAEKEIRQHAELVGLDIDVDLSYPDASQDTQPRTFSPSYGLQTHDGLSWAPSGGLVTLDF